MSTTATCWEDAYRVQTERIAELERENAKLRCDVYQCPPTSENSYEGLKWSDACAELERENAELNATLVAVIAADERAVTLWRAAHPGNELVIPDRAKLVGWLLEQNAALRKDYVEMGQTALRSEINHYIGSIIMTDEQRKLREAVKKELPERASWAEIYAVYEIVRDRTKEAQP